MLTPREYYPQPDKLYIIIGLHAAIITLPRSDDDSAQ